MSKQKKLEEQLGGHIVESAGGRRKTEDRYTGFLPKRSAGEMSLDRIVEDPGQPRKSFDQAALEGLAANIKAHGVQQPIQLRWSDEHHKWLIVYGHRRYRASKLAGQTSIPCSIIEDAVDESTIRVRQLVENCQREELPPMEMARAIESLCEMTQWSNRHLAQELGVDHRTIGRHLDLLKLPEDLQASVENGKLAPSVAIDVLRIKDRTKQRSVGHEIAERRLTRSQAKQRINEAVAPPNLQPTPAAKQHELLTKNANITVYRHPDCSDGTVKFELMALASTL